MKLAVMSAFFLGSALGQVVITDTGSTNRPGMTVTVGAKGNAVVADRRGGATVNMTLQADLKKKLMQDLEAAAPVDQLKVRHCAKSVSFGSRTFVTYNGVRSPDISCQGQSDPVVIALQKDVDEIMAQAHAKMPNNRFR